MHGLQIASHGDEEGYSKLSSLLLKFYISLRPHKEQVSPLGHHVQTFK